MLRVVAATGVAAPKSKPRPAKRKADGTAVGGTAAKECFTAAGAKGAGNPVAAKARKKKPAKATEWRASSDPSALARDLLSGTGEAEGYGGRAHNAFAAAARLEAVQSGKLEIKQQRGQVVLSYGRNQLEKVKLLSEPELVAVAAEVATKASTKRRRNAGATARLFTLDELARRSPPLFWSAVVIAAGGVTGMIVVTPAVVEDVLSRIIAAAPTALGAEPE